MSAAQTLDERALPLHKAHSPALKLENNTAISGIVVGIAISLPLWAAIVTIGIVVLRWV
jgi:hypothetical protein